jgi:hypothetical protein
MAGGATYGPHRYQFELGKRNYKFGAEVDEIVQRTEKRMLALMRERTVNDAQIPVAKGGKMRVDTGFLRASGQGSLNGMPTGPSRGDPNGTYPYDPQPMIAVLGSMQLGAVFHFGWTANYAKYREAYDGFLESALQKWPQTVEAVTTEIKGRIAK